MPDSRPTPRVPTTTEPKPLMRSLGEFVGHVMRGLRTEPLPPRQRTEVRRDVEERRKGDLVFRRTTIDEIEVRGDAARRAVERPDRVPRS